jgi:hypothetical protein
VYAAAVIDRERAQKGRTSRSGIAAQTRGVQVSDEMKTKIKAAGIRFFWTWVFAFVSQPVILAIVARIEDGTWDWSVAWAQVAIAALAAVIYALKKYRWSETTW